MVYAVRTNKPIIAKHPLKQARVQGEHSKEVQKFMETHIVSIQTDANGKIVISTAER